MKQILNSKINLICIIVLSGIIIWLPIVQNFDKSLFSIVYTILMFYLIYLLVNIIELLLFKITMKTKIKYLVIYPFTYDGKICFKPFELLMNQDGFSDSLVLNLVDMLESNRLKKEFMKITVLRKISIVIVSVIFGLITFYVLNINIILNILIYTIFALTLSFFYYNDQFCGQDYFLLYSENINEFLYKGKCIKDISLEQYKTILTKNNFNKIFTIDIMQNYLYKCFIEEQVNIDITILDNLICNIENKMLYQNILNEIYVRNIIKLIGLVGKYIDNNDYLEYSLRKLNDDLYNYYEEIPTAVYYDNPIAKYIEFLETNKPINIKDQLILGKINTFSYISYIEDMMFIFTENISNEKK